VPRTSPAGSATAPAAPRALAAVQVALDRRDNGGNAAASDSGDRFNPVPAGHDQAGSCGTPA
jgi:hypothetical protein